MTNDVQLRPELAAGGILWRRPADTLEILIVHRPAYNDWAFPKGKLDPGESLLRCAIREVQEETGFSTRVGRKLPQVVYTRPNGKRKKVAFWAMSPTGGKFKANEEIDKIKWVPIAKAAKRLTYAADRDLIGQLTKRWTDRPRRILLVRHANAGDRHHWEGKDDMRRPLSPKGIRQAKDLSKELSHFDVDRVATSPATRCIETIGSIASAADRVIKVDQRLWEDAPILPAAEMVLAAKRGTTILCTHGPIVAGVLRAVLGTKRPIPHEKGSTWVLDVTRGVVIDANYFAPDAVPHE